MFDSFADIQLDIPNAHTLLEKFADMCAQDGIIPISLTLKVPSRYVELILTSFIVRHPLPSFFLQIIDL